MVQVTVGKTDHWHIPLTACNAVAWLAARSDVAEVEVACMLSRVADETDVLVVEPKRDGVHESSV